MATGSLGQGLSVGVGLALNAKFLDNLDYRTFVLMGDGESAEGGVWEAAALAAFYKLDNLVNIIDVNRLGQSQETMYGSRSEAYQKKFSGFGWHTIVIDGHKFEEILKAFQEAEKVKGRPTVILARTRKGKGVSFMENVPMWHFRAPNDTETQAALSELKKVLEQ